MGARLFQVVTLIAVLPLALTVLFIPIAVFYILTLRSALLKCAPESRSVSPGKLWLLLIPFFNLGRYFVVVLNMARSLRNESVRRNFLTADPEPGKSLGLATCILMVSIVAPLLGPIPALAGFICWIVYWVKIAEYSRRLDEPIYISQPAT